MLNIENVCSFGPKGNKNRSCDNCHGQEHDTEQPGNEPNLPKEASKRGRIRDIVKNWAVPSLLFLALITLTCTNAGNLRRLCASEPDTGIYGGNYGLQLTQKVEDRFFDNIRSREFTHEPGSNKGFNDLSGAIMTHDNDELQIILKRWSDSEISYCSLATQLGIQVPSFRKVSGERLKGVLSEKLLKNFLGLMNLTLNKTIEDKELMMAVQVQTADSDDSWEDRTFIDHAQGCIHALDTFIWNEDRFDTFGDISNRGNILEDNEGNQIAIDNEAVRMPRIEDQSGWEEYDERIRQTFANMAKNYKTGGRNAMSHAEGFVETAKKIAASKLRFVGPWAPSLPVAHEKWCSAVQDVLMSLPLPQNSCCCCARPEGNHVR